MSPAAATTRVVFSPGPLGFELEPLWQAGGRATGCRVTGFKRLPDGSIGQAELMGSTRPGDVLAEVDGVAVSDASFDKIIALLLHNANRPERLLTFRSGGVVGAAKESPADLPLSPTARDQRGSSKFPAESSAATITSTGGSTQPATPSPGFQPRPAGDSDRFSEERPRGPDGLDGMHSSSGERPQQQREQRRQRVMGFLGMGGGRPGEAGATAGSIFGPGDSSSGEDGDSEWWRGAQQVGGFEDRPAEGDRANPDGCAVPAAAAADAAARGSGHAGEERSSSQGVARLFFEGGQQSTDDLQAAGGAPASPTSGAARRRGRPGQEADFGAAASRGAGDSSLSEQAAGAPDRQVPVDSIGSANAWSTALHAAIASGGSANGRSGAPPAIEKGAPPPKYSRKVSDSPLATSPPIGRSSDVVSNRVSTGTTVLDGGQPDRRWGGGGGNAYGEGGQQQPPRDGSPDTVGQSLDTVSLLSEPVAYSKEAKQRVSMLASLWGGGGGQGGDEAEDMQGSGDSSEVEGARRLARSLAVKLKERARRCEELEDLFGLRDHQVSQLQRQSNSLAARASSLADDLADQTALVEALQQDRARLEQELAQSRLERPSRLPRDETDTGGCETGAAAEAASGGGGGGDESSLTYAGGSSSNSGGGVVAATGGKAAVGRADAAAAMEAAERKAGEAVAAAEARCLALTEMVDSLVAEKVGWEEERTSAAAEAMRLRARARGLEEAVADRGAGDGEDGGVGAGDRTQALLVEELRKLLRERTRELEVKSVAMERLAAHARELKEEKRRVIVSLSAREEDLLVSDRQMRALSARLKGEARASGEAAARAEAVADELRTALEEAAAAEGGGDAIRGKVGDPPEREGGGGVADRPPPLAWDRAAWAEERARLHHNLLSLREALRDREAQAEADDAAASSRLKVARDDGDRSARERASLREALDSLRVELAEALVAAAASPAAAAAAAAAANPGRSIDEGVYVGGGGGGPRVQHASSSSSSVAAGEKEEGPRAEEEEAGGGGNGEVVRAVDGGREEAAEDGVGERESVAKEGSAREPESDWRPAEAVVEGRKLESGGAKSDNRRTGSGGDGDGTAATGGRDRWLDGGFEGTIDDLQLDLMEKDIVIEQLRGQLKQLRSKLAVMEEEQAADAAPLQGLLHQLGELKGSVEEREEREQQCRDQVDVGLMRMERLKEENAAATATATAAVTSPPVSFAGSTSASPPFLPQADPSRGQAQVVQQRLRRQLEDLQWDLRTAKRRVEERDSQLRDARSDGDRHKKRARDAERDFGSVQSEMAIAAAEAAAQRRRAGALRAELLALRAELQSAHERAASTAAAAAKSSAEEQRRPRLQAEGSDYASAATAEAETNSERAATLLASLKAVTAERDELLAAAVSLGSRAEDGAARTREVESMRCAVAARDVELESIVDATASFVHHADGSLGGYGAASGGGGGSGSGNALRCALAAATEARRAQSLAGELREEASSLKVRVKEGHAEASRLRAALDEARLAEKRSAADAAAAAAASAGQSFSIPAQNNGASLEEGGYSAAEARAADKRAGEAEEALRKALAGAQRAWGVVSSCLAEENRIDEDDPFGANANTSAPPLSTTVPSLYLWQQPPSSSPPTAAEPPLGALVSGVETLAAAYRRRGHALRRATVATRAKTVCSREARRREEAEARARGEVEGRLEEALVALDHCQRRHHEHQQHQQKQPPASWGLLPAGGWAAGVAGSAESRPYLSKDQEEHLRQIRSEVDRLEDQNRTLRRSLEGGDAPGPGHDRLLGKTTEFRARGSSRGKEVEAGVGVQIPTQRLLFPPSSGATSGKDKERRAGGRSGSNSRADCWDRVEGLGGSSSGGQGSRTPSPSPVRSWAAVSNTRGGAPWPPRREGGAGDGEYGRAGCNDEEEEEEEDDDARARVLEECAGYCAPPHEDGSGGTLVPAWSRNA